MRERKDREAYHPRRHQLQFVIFTQLHQRLDDVVAGHGEIDRPGASLGGGDAVAGVLAVLAAGTFDHIGLHHLAPRSLEVLANGLEDGGDLLIDELSLAEELESGVVVVGLHDVLLVGIGGVVLCHSSVESHQILVSCTPH